MMGGSAEGLGGANPVHSTHLFPPPMIELTENDVREFQALFRRKTGKQISEEQARAYASSLIRLVSIVARASWRSAR
jgi:hypothetical protein